MHAMATAVTAPRHHRRGPGLAGCLCTQSRLGAVEIVRLCECDSRGNSKRKGAHKTRRDKTAFHDCVPFVGHVGMRASKAAH